MTTLVARRATLAPMLLVLAAVALVAAPLVLRDFAITLLTLVLVTALLASSVDILAGEVGLVSIGHAGIAAASAYAIAWGSVRGLDPLLQIALALALTIAVSVVYAVTTMRTNGIVFLMITLALGIVVYGLALKLSTITGGQNGITGIRRPAAIADPAAFYVVALMSFALVSLLRWVLARSPFGLVLHGARESETRMASLGYSVARAKLVAVVLSGLVAGWAGILIVWQAEFMSPNVASFARSANGVVMVILGGVGTLLGPVVGAAVVVGAEHWISSYVERWPTLLGFAFIAVVLFAPRGVMGIIRRRAPSPIVAGPEGIDPEEAGRARSIGD